MTFDPALFLFLAVLAVPVALASFSGLVFSSLSDGLGRKQAMLVGVGMGVAIVGAGFGLYSGFLEVMDLIYPSRIEIGNKITFNHYAYQRYLEEIAIGIYGALFVLGPLLTWLACHLRSKRPNRQT